MSCNRSPQHNSYVIPGKLATVSATRNPGISKRLDTGFRRYDTKETEDLFNELLRHHARALQPRGPIAAMVAYLANPEAGFVTGASLTIDGHTLPERSRSTEVPRAVAAAVRAAVTAMGGGWQSPFRQLKAFTPKEAHAVFYARPHKSIL